MTGPDATIDQLKNPDGTATGVREYADSAYKKNDNLNHPILEVLSPKCPSTQLGHHDSSKHLGRAHDVLPLAHERLHITTDSDAIEIVPLLNQNKSSLQTLHVRNAHSANR